MPSEASSRVESGQLVESASRPLSIWQGPVQAETDEQIRIVRGSLGQVPPRLLPDGTHVIVARVFRRDKRYFGWYEPEHQAIVLNRNFIEDTEACRFDILHEVGHAVMTPRTWRSRIGECARELHVSTPSSYMHDSIWELWAEAFAFRVMYGTSIGPKTDALFEEMGV
jgi:hypothetical protein